uniref:type II secretion system protein n=1 Tax=Methanobrevibacter smithii TaxID=2173 RepID=UPI00384A513C
MKEFTKNSRRQEGITLVALVITVVVMLILAGVAIAAIVDGDGLFNKTRQAAESYENATRYEADKIKTLMNEIDNYLGNVDDEENNPPTGGATIGEIVNENKTFDGQATGTYNNPIIPKGFAPVNENNATWGSEEGYQKGLVITDAVDGSGNSTGNEFVWVPVDGNNVTFGRYDFGKGVAYSSCSETVPSEISTSITNNQGFYIARFEAGKPDGVTLKTDGSVKPVSKRGATVWNNIKWSESGTNDETTPGNGAVTVARSMYPKEDTNYGAISTLIYGTQWDTALRFIGSYNVGENGYDTYATNSTGMGNY